jgi:hypothetical protein
MFDPEFDNKAGHRHVHAFRSHKLKLFCIICITLIVSCLLGFSPYSRRLYTCAVCRANKVDNNFVGLRWSSQESTDCSRWYSENVERSHTHAWIGCTYCRRFGIPGLAGGYACFVGGPLTGLSRTVQMTIYQHFEDRLEAKRLFIRLGQMDAESNRLWEALMGWIDQDYPGTGHDWWEQQLAAGK